MRGSGPDRPGVSPSSRSRPSPDVPDRARTAVAVPSPRLRRSSPRRAWSGPSAPPSSRWTNPRTSLNASSNASHGLRSRHCVAAGSRTWPPAIRRLAVRPGVTSRRLAGRRVCRNARRQRGQDRRGAQVALDPVDDRGEADQLAGRVEREQLVDDRLGAVDRRESVAQLRAHLGLADVGVEPDHVIRVERSGAVLRAAALVATDRASIEPRDRPGDRIGGPVGIARHVGLRALGGPQDLVEDECPAARGAARRVQVAQGHLEAGLAARRGGHALERGVEMAHVGRSQDHLGEHPGEWAGLQRARRDAGDRRPHGPPSHHDRTGRRPRRQRWCGGRSGRRPGLATGAARRVRTPAARSRGRRRWR